MIMQCTSHNLVGQCSLPWLQRLQLLGTACKTQGVLERQVLNHSDPQLQVQTSLRRHPGSLLTMLQRRLHL